LTTLEFNTKREIIRALVKRIEIHHEEIVVVFRVDPDPDVGQGNDENAPGKSNEASSMQDCKRRCQRVAGQPRGARAERLAAGLGRGGRALRAAAGGAAPFPEPGHPGTGGGAIVARRRALARAKARRCAARFSRAMAHGCAGRCRPPPEARDPARSLSRPAHRRASRGRAAGAGGAGGRSAAARA
jgi:hypothetical protein